MLAGGAWRGDHTTLIINRILYAEVRPVANRNTKIKM